MCTVKSADCVVWIGGVRVRVTPGSDVMLRCKNRTKVQRTKSVRRLQQTTVSPSMYRKRLLFAIYIIVTRQPRQTPPLTTAGRTKSFNHTFNGVFVLRYEHDGDSWNFSNSSS